jgi:hypothetical protein
MPRRNTRRSTGSSKCTCDATMPSCTIELFTSTYPLPDAKRNQILKKKNWDSMCQQSIPWGTAGVYPHNAIDSAHIILVATIKNEVVGFLCGLDHTFITSLDGAPKPVAGIHEWYLDVVCARKGSGCGRRLIHHFMVMAKLAQKTQIRLYAVDNAKRYWKSYDFVECEDSMPGNRPTRSNCYERRYITDPQQGVRMTRSLHDIQV